MTGVCPEGVGFVTTEPVERRLPSVGSDGDAAGLVPSAPLVGLLVVSASSS
jgi:hypothetical protein